MLLAALCLLTACQQKGAAPVYTRLDNDLTAKPAEKSVAKTKKPSLHWIKKGDTLYSIAWQYKMDYRTLARWNHIQEPYTIYEGETLLLYSSATTRPAHPQSAGSTSQRQNKAMPKPDTTQTGNTGTLTKKQRPAPTATPASTMTPAGQSVRRKPVKWLWPTEGKLSKRNTPTAKKGINITGKHGQDIRAAADGEVVYSSDGLRMYGNMIIIKHNAIWLSAYAHNSELLVTEGDTVQAGQTISRMGYALGKQPMLHFEIRKDGKPTDPLTLLPSKAG